MYLCLDCNILFEEPKQYEECHGLASTPYETWSRCPECLGAYVETYECDRCGEYIIGEYIETIDKKRICENCYRLKDIVDNDY